MTPERWQQINALLDAVLELSPGDQHAYLEQHCDDPTVRAEVLSLLQAHDQADTFLESPAKEYAAPLIPMSDDTVADPMVGQEIDGYRITDVLGRGGMGVVYKAHDINLDKDVALKMIDPALAKDPSFVRRFRSEARALARIDSPYIVRVHAMRQTDAGLYIIMEYVDGGTVTDLLREGPMTWARARPIVREMLTALEHAHSVGVVHRDIKPSNIMLTTEGRVKVTDFGLAKLHQDGMTTVTQGISGTLFYMSPEQVMGAQDLDHRTDLYSMGITIYQMLAGDVPLDRSAQQFTVMRAIVEEEVPPLTKFRSNLPEHVVTAVKRSLEKDRDRRFQSAAAMRAAFEGGNGGGTAVVDTDETVLDREPLPVVTKPRWPVYTGIGGGMVVIAVLVWLFWPSSPGTPRLTVTSAPAGADVTMDGRPLGETPLTDLAVDREPGTVLLRVRKDGFVTVDTLVTLEAGATAALALALDALPDTADVDRTGTVSLSVNVGGCPGSHQRAGRRHHGRVRGALGPRSVARRNHHRRQQGRV